MLRGDGSHIRGNVLSPVVRYAARPEYPDKPLKREIGITRFSHSRNIRPQRRALLVRNGQNMNLAGVYQGQERCHWGRKNLNTTLGNILDGKILVSIRNLNHIEPGGLNKPREQDRKCAATCRPIQLTRSGTGKTLAPRLCRTFLSRPRLAPRLAPDRMIVFLE